jgi:uncharacterized metal-binding protein YceD (DUF177 family)
MIERTGRRGGKRTAEPETGGRADPQSTPWSVPVAVAEIPVTGRRIELTPDERVRAGIAQAAGVVAVPRLNVAFDLSRYGTDSVRAEGQVSATVVQECVVTLEPVESEINETVDMSFEPDRNIPAEPGDAGHQGLETADPPEVLQGGMVDLGALATEFLILGIDPFPRKPGAVFDPPAAASDPESRPFAALAALKKGGGAKSG